MEEIEEQTDINKKGYLGAPSAKNVMDRAFSQQDPYHRRQHPELNHSITQTKLLVIIE